MLLSLVARNNKVFFRNKTLVFFSLLSVIILVGLYTIFLQKLQVDAIAQFVPVTPDIEILVNEWMIAGLLSIIAMTATLGVFGIYIKDMETKTTADILVTAASRFNIQLSYMISSIIIGFSITFVGFVCCELYIVLTGGKLLAPLDFLKVFCVLVLAVLLSSIINLFIVLFIQTETAFTTMSTIIGTVLGFLCGIYVPMAVLPNTVQTVIHFFPISHITVLLRQIFMSPSIEKVFNGNETLASTYQSDYGIVYEIGGSTVSPVMSVLFIIGTILVVGTLSAVVYRRKYK